MNLSLGNIIATGVAALIFIAVVKYVLRRTSYADLAESF